MFSRELKTTAIILLCVQMALNLFFMGFIFSMELTLWFFSHGEYLAWFSVALRLVLLGLYAYYCYRKKYQLVFYGLVLIIALHILSYLDFFITTRLYIALPALLHGVSILLSKARENGWIRTFAIALIAITLIASFNPFIHYISSFLPLLFIFMIRAEKDGEASEDPEILDRVSSG